MIKELSQSIDKNDFWKQYHNFCDNIHLQDIEVDDLVEVLPKLIQRLENDYSITNIYKAISNFSHYHPNKAASLYEKILESQNNSLISFISSILKDLNDKYEVLIKIKDLLKHSNIEVKRQGYLAVVNLDSTFLNGEFLDFFITETESHLKDSNSSLTNTIAQVLYKHKEKYPNALDKLIFISRSSIPNIQVSVISILSEEIDNCHLEYFKKILLNLVSIKHQNTGICNQLQYLVLNKLIVSNNALVIEFIEYWLQFENTNSTHIKIFEQLFVTLYNQNNPIFSETITKWLCSEKRVLHKGVSNLMLSISLRDIKDIQLSNDYISTLTYDEFEFLTSKIIAYIYFKEHLRSMFYSLLKSKINYKNETALIKSVFQNYIIFNYASTFDYLESCRKSSNTKLKKIIKEIIDDGNKYYEEIKKLPDRNEFIPSEKRLNIYYEIHSKGMQEKQKEIQSNENYFLSMVKTIQLRTGRGMFTKIETGYTDRTEMAKISYSAELPRGEFIDPIGQEKQRRLFMSIEKP